MNKSFFSILLSLMATALLLGSCSQGDNYPVKVKYLTVKLKGSDKWSIVDVETGTVKARDAFDSVPAGVSDGMLWLLRDDGLMDLYSVDDLKHPVNETPFGSATAFNGGYALASKPGGPLTIIDTQCREVARLQGSAREATMFTRGVALVHTDMGRYQYLTTAGDTLPAGELAFAAPFIYDDVAVVSRVGRDSMATFSAIDKSGNELFTVSTAQYQLITPTFSAGVLAVLKADSIVYLNREGAEVPNPNAATPAVRDAHYDDGWSTPAGLYIVVQGGRMGLVDKKNNVKIPVKYQNIVDLSATRYLVQLDDVLTIVDENGKQVGDAQFTDYRLPDMHAAALRGFIDQNLAVATIMSLFDEEQAAGARPGGTLMDLNRLVGTDATRYLGQNTIVIPNGALTLSYYFNNDLARVQTLATDSLPMAQFNLDAQVRAVSITLNVKQCPPSTEQEIEQRIGGMLGVNGFVLDDDGIFTSDKGTAVTMGYNRGQFLLYYFMDSAYAQKLPHNSRQ